MLHKPLVRAEPSNLLSLAWLVAAVKNCMQRQSQLTATGCYRMNVEQPEGALYITRQGDLLRCDGSTACQLYNQQQNKRGMMSHRHSSCIESLANNVWWCFVWNREGAHNNTAQNPTFLTLGEVGCPGTHE